MTDIDQLVAELKQKRDELKLKVHLGSKEAQEQWSSLEQKWKKFAEEARLHESASHVGTAVSALGHELRAGYEGIKKALR